MGESKLALGASAVEKYLQHASADRSNNTTAVIVALPRPMDSIRLVGTEDKHATLLFFGETSTLPSDARFVLEDTLRVVANLFTPFTEEFRTVQRLGDDNPPALVAMLTAYSLNPIRRSFMINPKVREYLKNAAQFPQYTPHVTLDYPDYKREAELRDLITDLSQVRFDRLALWWGNEQIEFSLEQESEMKMSAMERVDAFLAHHGVKGMKWGVRRTRAELSAGRRSGSSKKSEEEDKSKASGGHASGGSSHTKVPSDQELQALVNRMRLEQEFKRLSSESAPSKKADGFIKSFLKETGKRQIRRVAGSAADIAIEQALKKYGAKTNNQMIKEVGVRLSPKEKKKE